MKKIILVLPALVLIISCSHNQCDEGYQNPLSETRNIYRDSEISAHMDPDPNNAGDSIYTCNVISGEKLVAVYYYSYPDCELVEDDDMSMQVSFEIDPDVNTFYITDDSLATVNCNFTELGFIQGAFPVVKGYIQGQKLNTNKWSIDFHLIPEALNGSDEEKPIDDTGYYVVQ